VPAEAAGSKRLAGALGRSAGKREQDLLGAADREVVGHARLKERAGAAGIVEHRRAGGLDLAQRELLPVPGGAIRAAQRVAIAVIERSQTDRPASGPKPSQMARHRAGSGRLAHPSCSASNPRPARLAWRLAHSRPSTQTCAEYGAELQTLMNPAPNSGM
jgi:hypothetical protein